MTRTPAATATAPATPARQPGAGVLGRRAVVRERLDGLRAARARADAAEVEILVGAADYADLHRCFSGSLDELLGAGPGLDEATALCAPPATELAEVRIEAPAEFGAALGLSSGAAARMIADALQLRHRLPLTWARVRAGRVQVWRARRIAQTTAGFPDDVVAAIDAAVAEVAQQVGVVTLDRLLNAAMMRLHPDEHEMRQHEALDRRHATMRSDISDGGTARMEIAADLVDLLDFDQALAQVAGRAGPGAGRRRPGRVPRRPPFHGRRGAGRPGRRRRPAPRPRQLVWR